MKERDSWASENLDGESVGEDFLFIEFIMQLIAIIAPTHAAIPIRIEIEFGKLKSTLIVE